MPRKELLKIMAKHGTVVECKGFTRGELAGTVTVNGGYVNFSKETKFRLVLFQDSIMLSLNAMGEAVDLHFHFKEASFSFCFDTLEMIGDTTVSIKFKGAKV